MSDWICGSCSASNPGHTNKCQGCGKNRPADSKMKLIIIGSVAGVALIILLVIASLKLVEGPKKKYKAALLKCCASTDCCGGGEISCAEADKIAASYKISPEDKEKLNEEVKKERCKSTPTPIPTPTQSTSQLPPSSSPQSPGNTVSEMKNQEAARHFQEGFRWVALARNSKGNNAAFEESMNNAINEYTKAIEIDSADDQTIGKAYEHRGTAYMVLKKRNKALEDLKKAAELLPDNSSVYYNLTCLYSLENKIDLALDSLDKALENGFKEYNLLREDSELKNLRKSPEYKTVLEKHKVFIK
ncbi:hypothetical protein MBAV_005052 [Candidatus Magnetobacterium bavaricum]|uniref:RanBP2-type domain-containing protein n=1 Tax=Candidatus Magnetobacterium bavaricum TaxID=29290 RepID=A0A0F3GLA8_9BACT|nr:hypothetical protein MBAV_005052 [Candidatus Magnetobacterium bavaricum]